MCTAGLMRCAAVSYTHLDVYKRQGEGSADAVHSQMDRHGGVSRVERDRWIDVVLLKEIQGDAAGVLVRVEENEVFLF